MSKKLIAEFFGTFVLVLFGCGTAVFVGGPAGGFEDGVLQTLTIAFAFGFSIVAVAYAIGDISGAHVNPAVSLGMYLNGRMSLNESLSYMIAQFLGAMAGSVLLAIIVATTPEISGSGADGWGEASATNISLIGAFIVEVVLTFVFVMTVLGVTRTEKTGVIAGIVIGLTLAFVHILGIPLTGTSVNPARGLSAGLFGGGLALSQAWLFVVAPFIGAAIAGCFFNFLYGKKA